MEIDPNVVAHSYRTSSILASELPHLKVLPFKLMLLPLNEDGASSLLGGRSGT